MEEKVPFTQEIMTQMIDRIGQAQNLTEIAQIGKELNNYEMDSYGFKAAVSKLYSARRRELADKALKGNKILQSVFFGFVKIQEKRTAAKETGAPVTFTEDEYFARIYGIFKSLEEAGVLTPEECKIVYDKVEQVRGRQNGNGNGNKQNGTKDNDLPF